MTKTVTDVVCPFCGTLCDDLEVSVTDDGKQILDVYNACAIGAEKFLHSLGKRPDHQATAPAAGRHMERYQCTTRRQITQQQCLRVQRSR